MTAQYDPRMIFMMTKILQFKTLTLNNVNSNDTLLREIQIK